MKNLLFALAGMSLLCGCTRTENTAVPPPGAKPQIVTAGKGSYASFPPPEVEKQARKTLERTLFSLGLFHDGGGDAELFRPAQAKKSAHSA